MTSITPERPSASWAGRIALVLFLGGIAAAGGLMAPRWFGGSASNGGSAAPVTWRVARGPLDIIVSETGSLLAREQLTLKNEVEGQTTIIFLIPDGTDVKKGDLLVELDVSKHEDEKLEQQIKVQNAEAAFIRAREQLEVDKSTAESEISKKALDFRFAQEDLKKYVEGDYPNKLKEAEAKITLAEAEVKRASQKLEWSRVLREEKYLSSTELEADELASRKAQLDLELVRDSLRLLKEFTRQREVTKLEADVDQEGRALERAKRKGSADVVQAEADLKAKESELQRQQIKLAKLEGQIAKGKILAPRNGVAVHATSSQGGPGYRGGGEPLAEGQNVRERQELVKLPTADLMMAEVKVHESKLDKLRPGLPVRIGVDALPGKTFTGKVARISSMPDATNMWMNPDLKVYATEIHFDQSEPGLRTGMTCQAQIVVAEFPDALYVPVQVVLRQGTAAVAFVNGPQGPVLRPIEVGLDNNRFIQIRSGLQEGEEVLLNPPLDAGSVDGGKTGAAAGGNSNGGSAPGSGGASSGGSSSGGAASGGPGVGGAQGSGGSGAGLSGSEGGGPIGGDSGGAAKGGGGKGGGGKGPGGEGGKRRQEMSEEERAEMKKRFEAMSPEDRERLREGRGKRRTESGEGSGGGGPGGGGSGEGGGEGK